MKLELIPAYLKLEDYIHEEHQNQDTYRSYVNNTSLPIILN